MKSRTKPVAVSLAVAAMLTAACGSAEPESAEGSPDRNQATPTTVNVGALAAASDAGLFIADARGYFEALGIEMEYQKVAGGEDLIPLLSTGRLDVGGLALNAGFFNAIASGNDLDVVADKGSFTDGSDPSFGALVVRSDLATQITGPADLAGRTIAAGVPGSIPDLGISAYLETGGLALDDVTMTTLGFPERVIALQEGAADAAFLFEPFLSRALESGTAEFLVDGGEMISDQQLAVIVYAGAFAEEQPEVAQDFMSAYVCALQDYNDAYAAGGKDLDEIITILAEATGQTPEVLKSTVPVALDPEGALNTDDLERTAQTLAEMGLATKELALEDFVDTSFLDGLTSCDELREMAADQ